MAAPDPLAAKRERLFELMTKRLGHEPIRRDLDSLNDESLDYLLGFYSAPIIG